MKNVKILIGLMLVIFAIVLLSGCVQQRAQDQTATPTVTPTATPKSEIQERINEVTSMVEDFEALSNSVNELDENEDLLGVFQGD